jgi:hypothetical protein
MKVRITLAAISSVFLANFIAFAQQTMPSVENSVGYQASGTSIQPKTTSESIQLIHTSLRNWNVMFHANAFAIDVQQNGPRGHDKFFSTNWLMLLAERGIGRSELTIRTMLSLEPLTITSRRYPLLFQTGETAYGLSIIDGQHPHDLFMELAISDYFRLSEQSQLFLYGGPVGEAALGPTPFPHRSSASENPLATIGHHMQDSTHIATNILTIGWIEKRLQLEATTFHAREPDENRSNINRGKPDSFAARVTVAPISTLSGQFSTGRIHNPEQLDPNLDTVRTTASLHHDMEFSGGHLSSSLIWGRNKDIKSGSRRRIFNSYNFETTANLRRNWLWTRIENVDRDRSLLPVESSTQTPPCLLCGVVGAAVSGTDNLNGKLAAAPRSVSPRHVVLGPGGIPTFVEEVPIGRVQAYTLGYERELPLVLRWINIGIGVQATGYTLPAQLAQIYGNHPATVAVFLRFRPTGNLSEHMKLMHQQR